MTSSEHFPYSSPLAPSGLPNLICLHALCLDARHFHDMWMNSERNWVYDTSSGVIRLSSFGGCVKRWIKRGGSSAVQRCDMATYVDIPGISCLVEETYPSRLALIVPNGS